jgi:hypothetical protein
MDQYCVPIDLDGTAGFISIHKCTGYAKTEAECVVAVGVPRDLQRAVQQLIAFVGLICLIVDKRHFREIVGAGLHPLLHGWRNLL